MACRTIGIQKKWTENIPGQRGLTGCQQQQLWHVEHLPSQQQKQLPCRAQPNQSQTKPLVYNWLEKGKYESREIAERSCFVTDSSGTEFLLNLVYLLN